MSFISPTFLALAGLAAAGAVAVLLVRRLALPLSSRILFGAGAVLFAIAAGTPLWPRPVPQPVNVMVDVSPSTRGAAYRDPAVLRKRLGQLLGSVPHEVIYFAQENRSEAPAMVRDRLGDLPAERTIFAPPPGRAVLLFSDGRFEPPRSSPPVYAVVDPLLIEPADAAVTSIEARGDQVAVGVSNTAADSASLSLSGERSVVAVSRGQYTLSRPLRPEQGVVAQFAPVDLWPENDRLELPAVPPAQSQMWWVGESAPAGTWRRMSPADLPADPVAYLAPAAIVLQDIHAEDLTETQEQLLLQYVRDLGGAVILVGGKRAFAAGEYPGTPLETLSPLASSPPIPTLHWIILADSSGSMAGQSGDATRWDRARQAIVKLLPHLPPDDPVTLASFSERVNWWSRGRPARETISLALPAIVPSGPTNLEPSLRDVIDRAEAGMPAELLLLSDTDAPILKPETLRADMLQKRIRLHVLVLGPDGRGEAALRDIARATGGAVVSEMDPAHWADAARKLFQQASPERLMAEPAKLRMATPIEGFAETPAAPWNRTWLKRDATVLAENDSPAHEPLIARWRLGAGQVLAVAYPTAQADRLAKLVATPPRDPRFKVVWKAGSTTAVHVEAAEGGRAVNGLKVVLEVASISGRVLSKQPVVQTAPGYYEASLGPPQEPVFATLRLDGRPLDRIALPARYASEFDAIGIDADSLKRLAARTGGAMIPPAQASPIKFKFPVEPVPLGAWLAAAAGVCIAAGLTRWRVS
ncbi:MAG: VWA domain-containing protein [Tepidisphaerales bacterium]